MADYSRFLSFLLGIAFTSTLLTFPKIFFEISEHMIPSDRKNFILSVETIVDSRFKILAKDFHHEIEALKGKAMNLEESEPVYLEDIIDQRQHDINKRQTSYTTNQKRPIKFQNINSSCTFFYADYPDDNGVRGNYSSPGIKKTISKLIKPICENSSSFCTFFHPDRPEAGLKKGNSSNATNEMLQDPSKVSGLGQPIGLASRLNRSEAEFRGTIEENNTKTSRSSKNQDEKIAKVMDWESKLAQLVNTSMEELKVQNRNQSKRVDQLEQKVAMLQNKLTASSALTRGSNKENMRNEPSFNNNDQVPKAATPPSSCEDLAMLDYLLDGLYLVKNKKSKKIQTVFCKFAPGDKIGQEFIGTVDVKTKSAHFYVQRKSGFEGSNAVISFELSRLNEGGAFNLTSGTFTVPVPGIYHFDFIALKSDTYLDIELRLNGAPVGTAYTNQGNAELGSYDVVSLSASLRLVAGDKVNLYTCGPYGSLHDDFRHYTHFTGWLVEEELI